MCLDSIRIIKCEIFDVNVKLTGNAYEYVVILAQVVVQTYNLTNFTFPL